LAAWPSQKNEISERGITMTVGRGWKAPVAPKSAAPAPGTLTDEEVTALVVDALPEDKYPNNDAIMLAIDTELKARAAHKLDEVSTTDLQRAYIILDKGRKEHYGDDAPPLEASGKSSDGATKPQPKLPRSERDTAGTVGRWLKRHLVGVGQFICITLGVVFGWIMFSVFDEALLSLVLGNKYYHPQAAWWTGKALWFVFTILGGWTGNLVFRFLRRRATSYDNSERNAR
jgi:hypothetical protein